MKKLVVSLALLGFSGAASAVPYMPWAQHCIEAEAAGTLGELKDYNKCNSKGYGGALNTLDQYYTKWGNEFIFNESIQSIHVVVTDIKLDYDVPYSLQNICEDEMCYRAIIYKNGDSKSGQHIATFVTTPGKPWYERTDPETGLPVQTGKYTNESARDTKTWVGNRTPEMYYKAHLVSDEMGLGGDIYNRFTSADGSEYYIMDHYKNSNNENMAWAVFYNQGTAFHSSPTVNGRVGSHGCTRLKYTDSRMMNYLARHTGRNFTVETRYTEREELTQEERDASVDMMAAAARNMKRHSDLRRRADAGDEDAKRQLSLDAMNGGGLY